LSVLIDLCGVDAEEGVSDGSALFEQIDFIDGFLVQGDREAEMFCRTKGGTHGGVDPDDSACGVDDRASAAAFEGDGIGLDQVVVKSVVIPVDGQVESLVEPVDLTEGGDGLSV